MMNLKKDKSIFDFDLAWSGHTGENGTRLEQSALDVLIKKTENRVKNLIEVGGVKNIMEADKFISYLLSEMQIKKSQHEIAIIKEYRKIFKSSILRAENKPEIFYRYMPINEYSSSHINDKKLYISHFNQFNDPYDGFGLQRQFFFDCEVSLQHIIFNTLSDYIRVRCFNLLDEESKKYDGLMWGHYGDSYKGVKIEYEFNPEKMNASFKDKLKFFKVNYVEQEKKSEYEKDNKKLLDEFDINILQKHIINKSNIWDYENEYRLCLFLDSSQDNYNLKLEDCGLKITKIILGYKNINSDGMLRNNSYLDEIINIIENNYADIFYINLPVNQYESCDHKISIDGKNINNDTIQYDKVTKRFFKKNSGLRYAAYKSLDYQGIGE